ncbi:MAG: helix-turn-helix transcriptional regulator [Myxococcales bacterium]|nr:helix-turn-helix transcriptional regulator [Myxococcales bacterium]
MAERFGERLRALRTERGATMGALARHLGVSVPYISDVERSLRAPLTTDKIRAAAEYLGSDPEPLFALAAAERGAFELAARPGDPLRSEVGAALMRGWGDLSERDLRTILHIVRGDERGR